jgi:hypothetical protein
LDAVVLTEWCSLSGNDRYYWPALRTAGSKLDLKYTYVASGPSLQVESKFSYALELVNLEQQAASDKLDKICILYYIGYKTERKIYDTINNISQR